MSDSTWASHAGATHTPAHAGDHDAAADTGTRRGGDLTRMLGALVGFPTFGPSAEDRGNPDDPWAPPPEPAAKEMHGRVVGRETVGGKVRVMIGLGAKHGVKVGMPGHLATAAGRRGDSFEIDEARDDVSYATLSHGHHDTVKETLSVVLNPGAKGGK